MKRVEADLIATDLKVAVVATRWNHFIVDRLVEGTRTAFRQHGGKEDNLELYIAPGSFELPLVAQRLAAKGVYDADVPISFGILTTDTIEQAVERAGTKAGNKGQEALLAAVETANLLRKIDKL